MLNIAENHNVPVWIVFKEYREYYIAHFKKRKFEPKIMTWDDIWVLDQHFQHIHPLAEFKIVCHIRQI